MAARIRVVRWKADRENQQQRVFYCHQFSKWTKTSCRFSMWRVKSRPAHMVSPQHQLLFSHLSENTTAQLTIGLNLWGLLTKTHSVQKLFTGNAVGWSWSWIVKNYPCERGSWAVVVMQVRLNGVIFRILSFVTPQVAGITFVNSLIKQNMLILWNANSLYYVTLW